MSCSSTCVLHLGLVFSKTAVHFFPNTFQVVVVCIGGLGIFRTPSCFWCSGYRSVPLLVKLMGSRHDHYKVVETKQLGRFFSIETRLP